MSEVSGARERGQGLGAPRGDGPGVGAAAVLLAASVLLSRLIGYVREMVLAHQVGAGAAMDAYRAAFQLPDLMNHLLAGAALSIALIPLYTQAQRERGEAAAERLFATVLGTTGALAVLGTLVLWWWAEPLTALQFRGFDAETQALTTRLTRIVLPAQVFFVTGGILRAVLMAHGRFGSQAAAPILYNLGIIAGGLLFGPARGPEGFVWGALVGALVGSLGTALWEARGVLRVRWRVAPLDRELWRYLYVAAPLMVGFSLLTVDEWYERWFGALLGEGAVARLGYARQLMLVPVAVVGQAIATAALPALARFHAEGRHADLERTLRRTLQIALVLAIFSAAAMLALAEPLVATLYRRGRFTAADAEVVASLLRVLCLAVPGFVVQQIATRAFFARGETWRPMILASAMALAAVPVYLELGRRAGPPGLAWAAVIAVTANGLATLAWARLRHGAPRLAPVGATLARALLVAAPAAAAAAWAQRGSPGLAGRLADLGLGGAAYAAVVLPGVLVLGDEVVRELLQRTLRRLRSASRI